MKTALLLTAWNTNKLISGGTSRTCKESPARTVPVPRNGLTNPGRDTTHHWLKNSAYQQLLQALNVEENCETNDQGYKQLNGPPFEEYVKSVET